MNYIFNWRARRAGGRITVYGTKTADGSDAVRVPHIDVIEHVGAEVVATDKDGKAYVLRPPEA